jgi:hypothetical protein
MDLDPRLEQIVALFLSTTFDGERANCRSRGETFAQRAGMTFDEAVALYGDASVFDVFTLWRTTQDDGVRQAARRRVESMLAGQTFEDAFRADLDLRYHGDDYKDFNPEDRGEAREPGYKVRKAREARAIDARIAEAVAAALAEAEAERNASVRAQAVNEKAVNEKPVNEKPVNEKAVNEKAKRGRPKVHDDRKAYRREWMRQRRASDKGVAA